MGHKHSCCKGLAADWPERVCERKDSTPPGSLLVTLDAFAQHEAAQEQQRAGQGEQGPEAQQQARRRRDLVFHRAQGGIRLLLRGPGFETWLVSGLNFVEPGTIKLFQLPIVGLPMAALQEEVLAQTTLSPGHVNLLPARQLFLTPESLGLAMGHAPGGSLASHVADRWRRTRPHGLVVSEDEALYFLRQLMAALAYCHRHNLAHGDLSLDNLLLDGSDPPVLQIAGFAFASDVANAPPPKRAPHVRNGFHGGAETQPGPADARSHDIWSAGVMLLLCLCGAFPFGHAQPRPLRDLDGPDDCEAWGVLPAAQCPCCSEEWELVRSPGRPLDVYALFATMGSFSPTLAALVLQEVGSLWREGGQTGGLSLEAADLLERMLEPDPRARIGLAGVQQHAWFRRRLPPHLQAGLNRLAERQAARNRRWQAQPALSKEKVAERRRMIRKMVAAAGPRPGLFAEQQEPREQLSAWEVQGQVLASIDLTEAAVLESPLPLEPAKAEAQQASQQLPPSDGSPRGCSTPPARDVREPPQLDTGSL